MARNGYRGAGRLAPVLAVVLACAVPVAASGESGAYKDFTFKKVTPPKRGVVPKLPQIDPEVQKAALAAPKPQPKAEGKEVASAPAAKPDARYGWFWDEVSPDIGAASPARLELALNKLSAATQAQRVAAPRLSDIHAIAKREQRNLLLNTVNTGVSPALVLAVIAVESSGRSDAVSGAGAQGLMQLIPATAERFGVTDSMDPAQNIKGGVAYLDWLLKEFNGDPMLALAGYNAGENAVKKHGGVPPYSETRDYVPKVLAAYAVARALCKTPPMLISDGCVFNLGS